MDYGFGLGLSSKLAIGLGFVLFISMLFAFREQLRESKIVYFLFFILASAIALIALLGTYIVVNSSQYFWIGSEAIQDEFKHGKVALRMASALMIFKMLMLGYKLFIKRKNLSELWLKDKDFTGFVIEEYRKPIEVGGLIFFQYALYIAVLIFLWICALGSLQNIFVASVNWAVLYIIDDWGIIAFYTAALKGRMPTFHKIRLICINILFVGACSIITNIYLNSLKTSAMCILINLLGLMSVIWLLNDYGYLKKKHGT